MHPRLRGYHLVTKYVFIEGSCVLPNKASYMDDETWEKVVKLVDPDIRKMVVIIFLLFALFYYLII